MEIQSTVALYLAVAELEPHLGRRHSSCALQGGDARDVAQLEGAGAADYWVVHGSEPCCVEI